MKPKTLKSILLALTLLFSATFLSPPMAYAESDDTDGTEIQVVQPEKLEIQLGAAWAGVEFQLRTDSGLYPDPIPVGADGVLRLEIGGSSSYVLSCLGLANPVPAADPEDTGELASVELPDDSDTEAQEAESATPTPAETSTEETPVPSPEPTQSVKNVAGIPLKHAVFFGIGILICVAVLVGLKLAAMRREDDEEEDFDDYDE